MEREKLTKTTFSPGEILSDGRHAFITDGRGNADGLGVLIGFTSGNRLCRSSGVNNYCKSGKVYLPTQEEIEELFNAIRHEKDIPHYSCIL